MLSQDTLSDLIHLRLSEQETRAILLSLTPDKIDRELLSRFVNVMRAAAKPFPQLSMQVMDCCGTGGSGLSHFNTSTAAAFVLAAAGIPVVKFGNRGMTSQSGSFDFLEGLGIPLEYPLEQTERMLEQSGIVFLFAPQCYPALAGFNRLRRSLGVKTVFNFTGPLLNPARPAYKLLGVSDAGMQECMADFLAREESIQSALVVRGHDNLDEISCMAPTDLVNIQANTQMRGVYTPTPYQAGFPQRPLSVAENIAIFTRILAGEDTSSVFYRMICLNAGAGLWVTGHVNDVDSGAEMAAQLIRDKAVLNVLHQCRRAYVPAG